MNSDGSYGGSDPTADDCIRAGLYWFSRRDLEAARAWWERATLLEPKNKKAKECMQLLASFQHLVDDTGDFEEPTPEPTPGPPTREELASFALTQPEIPLPSEFLWEETPTPMPAVRVEWPPPPSVKRGPPTDDLELMAPDIPRLNPDPLDFAAASDPAMITTTGGDHTPWDEGPSRTSVVTLEDEHQEFDAVAEQTPLPEIDRERFFGRVADDGALIEYMRSTGDLLVRRAPTLDLPTSSDSFAFDADEWDGAPKAPVPPTIKRRNTPRLARPAIDPRRDEGIMFEEAVEMGPPSKRGARAGKPAAPESPPSKHAGRPPAAILADARDRMSLDDFQGVLELIDQIPAHQRNDEANKLRARCRNSLLKMYESKIGPTDRVPKVRLSSEEVIWLNLNHRAGFILSQIDGAVTYEDLIALSGMDRLDTMRILAELIAQKVIRST